MAENFNLETNDEYDNFEVEFGEVTRIGEGTSDFNALNNRPKYNDVVMSSATNIPQVPTRTSDLANDSNYQTATEVQSAISAATAGKQDTLTAGNNISISGNTISATDTTYTAGNGLDLTGTVFSVDTDVVATQSAISAATAGKQDILTAGSNISISGNTISATDTTYTAGNGLDLTGTTFSVDTGVVATRSDLANVTSYITDATEYSASATYAVGDYAIYNGVIYQCNIAIVGGEAWDASHWDVVPSLQEQLDNTETWTFELEGGTTVTKKVVVR